MHRSLVEEYCRSLRCQRKLLLLVFSFKKHYIIAKIYISFYYFFKCMHKLCKIYLHEIFCRLKFHAFLQRVKGYFLLFQNLILYFCPLKRNTTIINSFSLYRCKNLLRCYRSISIWRISYNFQMCLTLYLILVSVKRF